MSEKLKDIFFTKKCISDLSKRILDVYPEFDVDTFHKLVFTTEWDKKELKEKLRHTTECMHETLPSNFKKAIRILKKTAPYITGFDGMIFPDYVELYGQEDFDTSLKALRFFTRYSSSEFAVRPFIVKDPERTMKFMFECTDDKNEHVRRFASEGCRPRLPWAMALPEFKKDPSVILPVLEKLKNDPSEYVRKSVANNLNDISKDNPEIALDLFKRWYGYSENTNWIVKHAGRTLLKAGNKEAMTLFGYSDPGKININKFVLINKSIKIGEHLEYKFEMEISGKSSIRLEYEIEYAKANNKTTSKVFKITENNYQPGIHSFGKKHSFAKISTRKYYSGKHKITIIVNGEKKVSRSFDLV